MHNNATKCNETLSKWCKNKHGASKIIDTLETYQEALVMMMAMISSNTASLQGARIEFLVPNRGLWWWWRSGTLSRKNVEPPMFSGQRL
jgi:hypothetical protein